MSIATEYKTRTLVPRWLTFDFAQRAGELGRNSGFSLPKEYNPRNHVSNQLLWQQNKGIAYASELVGSALLINDFKNPLVIEAAEHLIKNRNKTSPIVSEMAERALGLYERNIESMDYLQYVIDSEATRGKIAYLKQQTRSYPNNSIAWADLGFYYSMMGQERQAAKCLLTAISISPENKFILRSCSRLFLHYGDPESALQVLRNSPISKHDPWVVSAEVSISETSGLASHRLSLARKIIKEARHEDRNISELLSTIGTIEFKNGAIGKFKKLIRASLNDPTENSVAQAAWLAKTSGVDFEYNNPEIISFEKETLKNFRDRDFYKTVGSCEKWLCFQPFSSMPAVNGSYLASLTLGDHDRAIKICEMGLHSSPYEFMLLNNLVFSKLQKGLEVEAERIFNQIDAAGLDGNEYWTYIATKGLLNFRKGRFEVARNCYLQAAKGFSDSGSKKALAIIYQIWSQEEKKYDETLSRDLHSRSKDLVEKESFWELENVIARNEKMSLSEKLTKLYTNKK